MLIQIKIYIRTMRITVACFVVALCVLNIAPARQTKGIKGIRGWGGMPRFAGGVPNGFKKLARAHTGKKLSKVLGQKLRSKKDATSPATEPMVKPNVLPMSKLRSASGSQDGLPPLPRDASPTISERKPEATPIPSWETSLTTTNITLGRATLKPSSSEPLDKELLVNSSALQQLQSSLQNFLPQDTDEALVGTTTKPSKSSLGSSPKSSPESPLKSSPESLPKSSPESPANFSPESPLKSSPESPPKSSPISPPTLSPKPLSSPTIFLPRKLSPKLSLGISPKALLQASPPGLFPTSSASFHVPTPQSSLRTPSEPSPQLTPENSLEPCLKIWLRLPPRPSPNTSRKIPPEASPIRTSKVFRVLEPFPESIPMSFQMHSPMSSIMSSPSSSPVSSCASSHMSSRMPSRMPAPVSSPVPLLSSPRNTSLESRRNASPHLAGKPEPDALRSGSVSPCPIFGKVEPPNREKSKATSQRLYNELQSRLLSYFANPPADDAEYLDALCDAAEDLHVLRTDLENKEDSRNFVEKFCTATVPNEKIKLVESVYLRTRCIDTCTGIYGYAFVPPADPTLSENDLTSFANGRLVRISDGHVSRKPEDKPAKFGPDGIHFICNCLTDPEFLELMHEHLIDSDEFTLLKRKFPVGALNFLRSGFQGTRVQILSFREVLDKFVIILTAHSVPGVTGLDPEYRAKVLKSFRGEAEAEAEPDYWEKMQF